MNKKKISAYSTSMTFKLPYEKARPQQLFREQQRLVIAATIIASVLASKSIGLFDIKILSYSLSPLFYFSGITATLYIICTAASLKYSDPYWVSDIVFVGEKIRRVSYNASIDIFATYLLYFLIYFISEWITKNLFPINYLIVVLIITPLLLFGLTFFNTYIARRDYNADLIEFDQKVKRKNRRR